MIESRERPAYIGLAHELIHANAFMGGTSYGYTAKDTYKYVSGRNKISGFWLTAKYEYTYVEEEKRKEELAVVGLLNSGNFNITENMIRAEHNLWLRGKY